MPSKSWNNIFWVLFTIYILSFFLYSFMMPAIYGGGGSKPTLGIIALIMGSFVYGLGLIPNTMVVLAFIQRFRQKKHKAINQKYNWSIIYIILGLLGVIAWFFIGIEKLIGYYVWAFSSVFLLISNYFFIQERQKEILREEIVIED